MFKRIEERVKVFTPVAINADEVKELFKMRKGERLLWASAELQVPTSGTTDSTVSLGIGGTVEGFVSIANMDIDSDTGTVGQIVQGTGSLLIASGGHLFTAADTVDVNYVNATTPGTTKPVVRYTIHVLKERQ